VKDPTNWQEHKAECKRQIALEIELLKERAENLQAFLLNFDSVADGGANAIQKLADDLAVSDFEDEQVSAVKEIYQAGDAIMTAPGEGYW